MHLRLAHLYFLILASLSACNNDNRNAVPVQRVANPERGEILFRESGCITCHSLTGENMYGPPLNSIIGREINVTRNGKTLTVKIDRDYLLRSLREPGFEKVTSFQKKKMPVINLPEEDLQCLVDYIEKINSKNPQIQ